MDIKYNRLLSNSTWTILGNAGSKIIAFLLLPFYTKWLGTSGYGQTDLVTTYSSLLIGIMTLCVSDGIMIFVKGKDKFNQSRYFSVVLNFVILVMAIWLLIFTGFAFIFKATNIQNTFSENIWMIFLMITSIFLQNYCQQFVVGLNKIKLYSVTGVILCMTTFLFSYVLIPREGVIGYVWAVILSHLATSLFCFIASGSFRYYEFWSFDSNIIKEILSYTIPLIPNTIMWWLVNALNRPLMETHLGLSEIGIYSVANKFPGVISTLYGVLSVSLTISVLEEYGKPSFSDFFSKVFRVLFLMIILVAIILMCFSESIIRIFAAPEFIEAWKYMIVLTIGAIYSCMSGHFGLTFSAAKKTKYFFYSSLWGAGSSIILNFLLIPLWGLYGACLALTLSFFIMAISRYIYSLKYAQPGLGMTIVIYSLILIISAILTLVYSSNIVKVLVMAVVLVILLYSERTNVQTVLNSVKQRKKNG